MEAVPSGTDLEKRLRTRQAGSLSELTEFSPIAGIGTTGRDIVSDHAELVHMAGGNYILTSRGRAAFADLSAGNDTAMIELMSYWRHPSTVSVLDGGPGQDTLDLVASCVQPRLRRKRRAAGAISARSWNAAAGGCGRSPAETAPQVSA